ncbi:hypothetical protein [Rothia sp. CCM 9416]|uniref:hypothetical protein n=1 Tax=Rothia sp. CCM 9416 TaxID=3402655 RepID=UPI003AEB6345
MPKPNRKIAIPRVLDSHDTKLKGSNIPKIEDNPAFFTQNFFCYGKIPGNAHCRAKACAKTKYEKTMNGKTVPVSGNFYLAPGSTHQADCSFDFVSQAHQLHTTYQNVIVKEENHFLLTIPSSRRPWDSSRDQQKATTRKSELPSIHTSKSTQKSRQQLQRVRMAATSIIELLERFEDDDKLRKLFRVRYVGAEYGWDEFFFNADTDVQKLYQTVQLDKQKGISRPLVLYGTVGGKPELNKKGQYPIWVLNRSRAPIPGDEQTITVRLYTPDKGASKLEKHQRVLAIGTWFIGTQNKRYLNAKVTAETFAPMGNQDG